MDAAATRGRSLAARLWRIGAWIDVGRTIGEKGVEGGTGGAPATAGRVRGGQMSTSLINAMGLTLAHFLWEGAVIVLLLLVFWRAEARIRYAAACAALAAMPVACALTFAIVWQGSPAASITHAPL